MADENGIIKSQRDTGQGFASSADDVHLIDNEQTSTDTELPNSPVNNHRTEISPLQMESMDDLKAKKKTQEGLKIIIISSITFALSVTLALILTIVFGPPAVAPHGAVASDNQLCSDMGLSILKQGGSAVDSAVTTMLCLGVVHPHHSGIGGGHFMIIRQHGKNISTAINAREKAPGGATGGLYLNNEDLKVGILSVAVPGSLRGMELAHKQYGKLSWKDLVTPVADLARQGFPVTGNLVHAIKDSIDPSSPQDDALVQMFYRDGQPVKEGDVIVLSDLADVLDILAKDGVDIFYKGKYAEEIINATSGAITAEDLANYDVLEVKTLKKSFLNSTVETMPAPGGGPLMLFMLSVLENYTLSEFNQSDPLFYHRLIEVMKFMAGERYRFGDPEYVNTVANDTKLILSQSYVGMIRNKITDDKVHDVGYYTQPEGVKSGGGTSHVSIIDPEETLVSVTSTINSHFGSHVVTPSGIILNNQMYDFDLPVAAAAGGGQVTTNNNIEPGKRPQSSMTPTIVHQYNKLCAARIALGGVNVTHIISGVAQVLLNNVAFGQDLAKSIEAKRICNPLIPNEVEYESGFSEKILKYLKNLGHSHFVEFEHGISYVHGIAKINETVTAHGDMRESGSGASTY